MSFPETQGLALAPSRLPARRVVCITEDPQLPSYRHRMAPVLTSLKGRGWDTQTITLDAVGVGSVYGWRLARWRSLLESADLVVLHKLRLDAMEWVLLQRWAPTTVYDIDDAVWLQRPRFEGEERAASGRRLRNFAAMCSHATLTVAGNEYLAAAARAHAPERVVVVPTAVHIPPDKAITLAPKRPDITVAWVGMGHNVSYLEPLRPVFANLCRRYPQLRLRVLSSQWPEWKDVRVEPIAWSEEVEHAALCTADIGIMPLFDDSYARGKCAFKLFQYMAAGLPCVASPVGPTAMR